MIVLDVEFCFTNGDIRSYEVIEARGDRMGQGDAVVVLEIHPNDTTIEEVIVNRSALAYMRTVKRTVEPSEEERVIQLVEGNG